MRSPATCRFPVLLSLLWLLSAVSLRADLLDYVQKPDPQFSWKLQQKSDTPQGTLYDLQLVSQVWQNITWTHQLQVYQPRDVAPNAVMFLYNTGGDANPGTIAFGMDLARKIQAPVAFLYHIPNQPLLGGKKEDALIAETFVRYLEGKGQDGSWPLLFPMVKSVVRAMDALQAFAQQEWKKPVKSFVLSGGSKRGWTTWLTGAVDPRIQAIAPMVIDTLNMVEQMEHQKKSFGTYSRMIHDYTERNLVPLPDTEEARKLWKMVDPYFYRDKITMPKMLILGNNDPYWTVDALNLYWDGLKADRYIAYVPNAGHDLRQKGAAQGQERRRAVDALAAFARFQVTGKALPRLEWKHDDVDGQMRLTVTAQPAPKSAEIWLATAPTRDFRETGWSPTAVGIKGNTMTGTVTRPKEGYAAFYMALEYEIDGLKYPLCTQIRVVGK
jgi:PhoPQ-activated pathogenicity-related protein